MNIAVGSDHAGFEMKRTVVDMLERAGHSVEDVGCPGPASVDYPDFAREVALRIGDGRAEEGVLICGTGIGMSIAANKFPGIRAALCCSPESAAKARTHNDANVLVLGSRVQSPDQVRAVVEAWQGNVFSAEERHRRRLAEIRVFEDTGNCAALERADPELGAIVRAETARQQDTMNLIASENYASRAVRQAQGSALTNKYAEGYPGKRWYNGCRFIDQAEDLAIRRATRLFGAAYANVQPHCGSSANMAVYLSALEPGDAILAMSLAHGGHLTHGHKINFSGRLFNVVHYGVSRETERIDMGEVTALARQHRPRLIVVGASAYSRELDFEAFREVARGVGAKLMVDMAHIAGLVAGGSHPSPVPYADYVTTTTHKTLRGPRGGMILARPDYADEIDRQVFPGIQGGPEMHTIAAKAVCLGEALTPAFRDYAAQVVANARAMAEALAGQGFRMVSGGTDNHLMLVDLTGIGVTGLAAASALERTGIVVNKNVIPFDTRGPAIASGIRVGTPAATTRGMKEEEMRVIAALIGDVLRNIEDETVLERTRARVAELTGAFPAP